MLPSVSCRTPRRRAPDSSADSSSRPRLRPPHGGSDREVVDRPEPVTIDMAERDAGDLLFPLRGRHHRRLAGQPVAEEAGIGPAGAGLVIKAIREPVKTDGDSVTMPFLDLLARRPSAC